MFKNAVLNIALQYAQPYDKTTREGRRKLLIVRKREKTAKMNRSRYEIIAGIVQNCLSPRCKTHIMYKNNLSFAQANAYLSLLISLGLLTQENDKYGTTDKGRQFISAYDNLGKIMGLPAPSITRMSVLSNNSAHAGF